MTGLLLHQSEAFCEKLGSNLGPQEIEASKDWSQSKLSEAVMAGAE